MTKFNPQNKPTLTYGEVLDPAMRIKDEADARQYMHDYVIYIQRLRNQGSRYDRRTAEQVARANLAWYAEED